MRYENDSVLCDDWARAGGRVHDGTTGVRIRKQRGNHLRAGDPARWYDQGNDNLSQQSPQHGQWRGGCAIQWWYLAHQRELELGNEWWRVSGWCQSVPIGPGVPGAVAPITTTATVKA